MEMTVAEAATRLGISPQAVRQFISEERLKARKVGRDWILELADVARFDRRKRKPGRPA